MKKIFAFILLATSVFAQDSKTLDVAIVESKTYTTIKYDNLYQFDSTTWNVSGVLEDEDGVNKRIAATLSNEQLAALLTESTGLKEADCLQMLNALKAALNTATEDSLD